MKSVPEGVNEREESQPFKISRSQYNLHSRFNM